MGNVTSFEERSKCFEEAHRACREVLGDRIGNIENFIGKWLPIVLGMLILVQLLGFTFFYFAYVDVLKKVDHRFFLLEESLEDIHKAGLSGITGKRDFSF